MSKVRRDAPPIYSRPQPGTTGPSAPKPAETKKTGETAKPSTFEKSAPQAPAKAAGGLPIASVVPSPTRAHGAVGAFVAYQLAQHWKREPGEKRIPKKAKQATLATLPEEFPGEENLSEEQVLEWANEKGGGRKKKKAKQLMAGMSGAQVFSVEDERGDESIFKMFCTEEEMLQDIAGLEVIANVKGHSLNSVAVSHAGKAHGGKNGFVVMDRAKGTVLYDRIDQVAAATGHERKKLLELACEELTCAGVALASFHEAGRSGEEVPESYKRLAVSRVRALWSTACRGATSGALLEPATRARVEKSLNEAAKQFMLTALKGTVCVGDVHPGNVAVHHGQCTVFDVSTLVASLGAKGQGIAPAADDRVWFAETIPWYARKRKLSDAEGEALYQAFNKGYRGKSLLAAEPGDRVASRLFKTRSALMDLRFAPDSADELARVLAALEEKT